MGDLKKVLGSEFQAHLFIMHFPLSIHQVLVLVGSLWQWLYDEEL